MAGWGIRRRVRCGGRVNYVAAVSDHRGRVPLSLFPHRMAREAAVFTVAVALFVDTAFYVALAQSDFLGGPLMAWSGLKILIIVAGTGWLAWETGAWAFGLIALIFAVIGLEDSVGITAPLGTWLIEEGGIRRGPRGSNEQLLRRGATMIILLGPTLYLGSRAPVWLRRAIWTLIGLLAAIFVVAVLGDVIADRSGTNLDEVVEEPLYSITTGLMVGLVVEWRRRRRLTDPTTGLPR